MKATSQTIQQIERALRKIAAKYPQGREDLVLTDIHLQVKADSGELLAFNDDDEELTRCGITEMRISMKRLRPCCASVSKI